MLPPLDFLMVLLTMPDDILLRTPPPYDLRLKYGSGPNQFGDLRLPKKPGSHPLLVMVHGGYWRAKYDLLYAGHLCAAFTELGVATFNLEYRRVGNPGGGWPGTFEDVNNGLRFIQQNSREHHINAAKSIVVGHSAGGQLALCLAHRQPSLAGAISLAGVLDLRRAYELHLSNDAVVGFLGGTPQQVPDHYQEASPIELAIPKVRQKIIHGEQDDTVTVEISTSYVEKKKREHENVQLVKIPAAGHFDLVDPESEAWQQVMSAAQDILA